MEGSDLMFARGPEEAVSFLDTLIIHIPAATGYLRVERRLTLAVRMLILGNQ